MPIPLQLQQLVGTVSFWSDYFGDNVFGEGIKGLPDDTFLEFQLCPRYSLRIGYFWRSSNDVSFIQATQLQFLDRETGTDFLLGWCQDDGHVHPHVLRWEDADLIGRLIAVQDPELPHPGIPFLLLMPYVASIAGSDHHFGLRMLNTALRSLSLFNDPQILARLATLKCVPANSEWRHLEPYGWVCHSLRIDRWETAAQSIHSLRVIPSGSPTTWPQFPFDAWNDCIRQVEFTLAQSVMSPIADTLIDQLPELPDCIDFHYQVTDSDDALGTVRMLSHALFQYGLGTCYLSGTWSAFENLNVDLVHPNADNEYIILSFGTVDAVVAVVRAVVQQAGNPDVRLYQKQPHNAEHPYRRIGLVRS